MVDAGHVERLVDVSDHVPESRRALETGGQFSIEVTALGQAPERLGVGRRRSEPQVKTGGGREIDHDLDGLHRWRMTASDASGAGRSSAGSAGSLAATRDR